MAGELNRSINTDFASHMQESEKRLAMEERRPRITKASDLLGPLAGPAATLLDGSLDSTVLNFNGQFLVPPGTPKSPDAAKWFMGESIANGDIGGVQLLYTFRPTDTPRMYQRGWEVVAGTGGLRSFSAWREVGVDAPVRMNRVTTAGTTATTSGTRYTMNSFGSTTPGEPFSISGGNTFTCVIPGDYLIIAQVAWPSNATGLRRSYIVKGASTDIGTNSGAAAAGAYALQVMANEPFDVGDQFHLEAVQSSGASLATTSARFTAKRLGA